jgi:uncharacterized iron-regulated membrane protein
MKGSFRQSMKWLHTWVGLVVGWILVFIFITGTVGYFDDEITRWMEPERPLTATHLDKGKLLDISQHYLDTNAKNAKEWRVILPNSRNPNLKVTWQELPLEGQRRGNSTSKILDTNTGFAVDNLRDTAGGRTLYRMHYRLHYMPKIAAYWIVGFCTMLMLIAVITGVIFHKKIFSDFFTFRAKKGLIGWLDIHNVLSVTAIPFHFMITYSGLVFFISTYMMLSVNIGLTETQKNNFIKEVFQRTVPGAVEVKNSGEHQPLASLSDMYIESQKYWPEDTLIYVDVEYPNDKNSRVQFTRWRTDLTYNPDDELFFSGKTGKLLEIEPKQISISGQIHRGFISLHEGHFASPIVRWLYLIIGLMGTAMVASGLILWTTKRKSKQIKNTNGPDFGYRLVEQLNIGTIVGLPIAIALYFWANRLLPLGMESRAEWEVHCLFIGWAVMLIYPAFRRAILGWFDQLRIAAFVFCFIPVLNFITTDKHLGVTLPAGDWNYASFDLVMLVIGLAFSFTAYKVKKHISVVKETKKQVTKKEFDKKLTAESILLFESTKEAR